MGIGMGWDPWELGWDGLSGGGNGNEPVMRESPRNGAGMDPWNGIVPKPGRHGDKSLESPVQLWECGQLGNSSGLEFLSSS